MAFLHIYLDFAFRQRKKQTQLHPNGIKYSVFDLFFLKSHCIYQVYSTLNTTLYFQNTLSLLNHQLYRMMGMTCESKLNTTCYHDVTTKCGRHITVDVSQSRGDW